MSGQDSTDGNFALIVSYAFLCCNIGILFYSGRKPTWSKQPNNEETDQVRVQVVLPVPACCDSTAYHAALKGSFFKSYKKERKFQMSLQGLGTGALRLEGRVKFEVSCRVRNARERFRNLLLKCHRQLVFSETENEKFKHYLADTANLSVKKDTEPFAQDGHHWNVDGSSGEPDARGALLHFLHIAPSLPIKCIYCFANHPDRW
jgi:hypothetical protein